MRKTKVKKRRGTPKIKHADKTSERLYAAGFPGVEMKVSPPLSTEEQLTKALTRLCNEGFPELNKQLNQLRSDNWRLEQAYSGISRRLVKMLTLEQLEAAELAGCAPEIYAIEWVMMLKDECRIKPPLHVSNYQQ